MDNDAFVQKVKMLCLEKGLKPTNVCNECGVGGSFLPDIKRGRSPSVDKVQKLAAYLGVTTSELLGEERMPTPVAECALEGLDEEQQELIRLYKVAPSAFRRAALEVLRSAVRQGEELSGEPVILEVKDLDGKPIQEETKVLRNWKVKISANGQGGGPIKRWGGLLKKAPDKPLGEFFKDKLVLSDHDSQNKLVPVKARLDDDE